MAPLAAPHAAAKPHVLLIVADDLGYGDVGCYGATSHNRNRSPPPKSLRSSGDLVGDDFRYVEPVYCGPELRSFPDGSVEGYRHGPFLRRADDDAHVRLRIANELPSFHPRG